MGRPRKLNQNPLLDFRSIHDDAWFTVGKLVLSKRNTILTVRFAEFDEDEDEDFNVKDFKTVKELDEFVNRFRPACVQLQDEECGDLSRGSNVCALLEEGEKDHKFYNGVVESVHREPHTRKGGEESCSCTFVVGWLEGPRENCTEQVGLERLCKLQPGSPLFDHALLHFTKKSRAQLDLVSNDIQLPAKKVKEVLSRGQRRSSKLSVKSAVAKSDSTLAKSFEQSCGVHTNSKEATLVEKMFQVNYEACGGNSVMKVEGAGKDTGLGGISMIPEVLNKVDGPYHILIENLEKDLEPLMIMSFLFNYFSINCRAFVFPSLSSDPSTRGIIVADTKEMINKLLNYLHNPDQLIVSSRGRPWVTSDVEPREGTFGNLWAGVEVLRGPELRAVSRGTDEFRIGKQLVEIFTNSANRLQRFHKSVTSEEEMLLLQNNTRSRKKLKVASEHKRMRS
ncbi:hypothetical protein MKX01_035468 [Papaver californicum]|nr:hypothetical protein MKX01_035468 [Papaver californicum]